MESPMLRVLRMGTPVVLRRSLRRVLLRVIKKIMHSKRFIFLNELWFKLYIRQTLKIFSIYITMVAVAVSILWALR
jgi:hypothetical protein